MKKNKTSRTLFLTQIVRPTAIMTNTQICLKIILKVTKNQGFSLSVEDKFFEKPQGGIKLTAPPPSRFRVKILSSLLRTKSRITSKTKICDAMTR